jgi:hypothetical protein
MECHACELEGTIECDKHCQPEVLGETTFQMGCRVIIAIILSPLFAYLWLIAAVIDYLIAHGSKNDKG